MKEYIGESGIIPGLGRVTKGDKIDETKLSKKLKDGLSNRLKDIKNTTTKVTDKKEVVK